MNININDNQRSQNESIYPLNLITNCLYVSTHYEHLEVKLTLIVLKLSSKTAVKWNPKLGFSVKLNE